MWFSCRELGTRNDDANQIECLTGTVFDEIYLEIPSSAGPRAYDLFRTSRFTNVSSVGTVDGSLDESFISQLHPFLVLRFYEPGAFRFAIRRHRDEPMTQSLAISARSQNTSSSQMESSQAAVTSLDEYLLCILVDTNSPAFAFVRSSVSLGFCPPQLTIPITKSILFYWYGDSATHHIVQVSNSWMLWKF